MTQDSGVNLSIYCCCFVCFFGGYLCILNGCWKNPSVDFCIGLLPVSGLLSTLGMEKSVHHKNHAEIVKGTITIL